MKLNTRSQEVLDRIVIKSVPELSTGDIAFLRARRAYLTEEQLKLYKNVLKPKKTTAKTNDDELSYKQLQKEASKLGMKNVVGKSKEKLIEFIKDNKR